MPCPGGHTGYTCRMLPTREHFDSLISAVDQALRTLTGTAEAARLSPAADMPETDLLPEARRESVALMRVNHAGEISAQALYRGQSLMARSEETRRHLLQAAEEEQDHLAWCAQRLDELDGRPSRLDPFWYAGSFLVGMAAGIPGDRVSLGFVAETERQVEAHLDDHLAKLPRDDARSRAVLEQMREDEAHHGTTAELAGGSELPRPVRRVMAFGGNLLRNASLWI